jgi:hypothetical protein
MRRLVLAISLLVGIGAAGAAPFQVLNVLVEA